MQDGKLKIAVAGLSFGGAFVPIYLKHPDIYAVDLIDIEDDVLKSWAKLVAVNRCWHSLDEALQDDSIDAIHLVTPIPLHAEQAVKTLYAGKHCACTVPAATSLDDLFRIVKAERETGKNYMMMETAVYTSQCIKIRELYRRGEFGEIQLMRGCHYQDMENWPSYWAGLPPMHYGTHALSPLLSIADARAKEVACFGSGKMREDLVENYRNPYPCETAIYRLENHPAAVEITRTLFGVPRLYCEGFSIYGSKKCFEWNYEDREFELQMFAGECRPGSRGRSVRSEPLEFPDTGAMLPPEIGRFTQRGNFDETNPQRTFKAGGGHHGSHPHLVHEFIRSILEHRQSAIHSVRAADWCAPGICAHLSAMKDGVKMEIPDFR